MINIQNFQCIIIFFNDKKRTVSQEGHKTLLVFRTKCSRMTEIPFFTPLCYIVVYLLFFEHAIKNSLFFTGTHRVY